MEKKKYTTPGVYIEERDAYSRSVVPVATAVPCFIGYTEKAILGTKSIFGQLIKIQSLEQYHTIFGKYFNQKYEVTIDSDTGKITIPSPANPYYLYNSLRSFYANGGGDCYIYAIGPYKTPRKLSDFKAAMKALENEEEPTIILAADALPLGTADYYKLWSGEGGFLAHCKKMINRFSIIDVYGGQNVNNQTPSNEVHHLINAHQNSLTGELAFGATYWPWVQATIVQPTELSFDNIKNWEDDIKSKIKTELLQRITSHQFDELFSDKEKLHNALMQISPLYQDIMKKVRDAANILPPSGALAGVYAYVDNQIGTFKAPANVGLGAVAKPLLTINAHDQESLNIPINGKVINAIRSFPGKGTLVWGARTLDGNSQDWRYVSVRRTVSMIELSVKYAAEAYVFEPNVSGTWTNIKAMISNFLNNLWHQGGLAGGTAAEAYSVSVGLGSTMTGEDILDGYLRIMVKVAITRPAEFIVITFQQQMQTS